MEPWTDAELDTLATTGELQIASRRHDGTLSPPVTIWAVRHDDDIYIRSVNGPSATWYRAALRRAAGRIWSGGVERDVQFLQPQSDIEDALDGAYRDKYGASSSATQRIIAPTARDTTIRITRVELD
jgi:hypothetical protein